MPESWKCPECGLVNFASDANCKRCGALIPQTTAPSVTSAGIVLQDGYVLPPPPMPAIWRERTTLVMDKNAILPNNCVKCNAPAHGFRVRKKLAWHHPLLYILIFGAALIYVIVAAALSKRATIEFPLCEDHRKRRKTFLTVGFVLLAFGLIVPIVGFANDYMGIGLFGILLFFVAVFWLIFAGRVVGVKKIDDRYAWLTGINRDFLNHFPPIPGGV
jgi:Zn-finger in Ran binding protein and others